MNQYACNSFKNKYNKNFLQNKDNIDIGFKYENFVNIKSNYEIQFKYNNNVIKCMLFDIIFPNIFSKNYISIQNSIDNNHVIKITSKLRNHIIFNNYNTIFLVNFINNIYDTITSDEISIVKDKLFTYTINYLYQNEKINNKYQNNIYFYIHLILDLYYGYCRQNNIKTFNKNILHYFATIN